MKPGYDLMVVHVTCSNNILLSILYKKWLIFYCHQFLKVYLITSYKNRERLRQFYAQKFNYRRFLGLPHFEVSFEEDRVSGIDWDHQNSAAKLRGKRDSKLHRAICWVILVRLSQDNLARSICDISADSVLHLYSNCNWTLTFFRS